MSENGDAEELKYSIHYDGDEEPSEHYTKDGKAKVQYANGDTFEGDFVDGKKTGQGIYFWKEQNATYDGEWNEDVRTGNGKFTYPDGSKYVGQWKENQRSGKGIMTYPNGDSYDGEFKNGLRDGQGTYSYDNDKSNLTGNWENDKFVSGKWRWNDKTQFVGAFNNNIPTGKGIFAFIDGNQNNGCYEKGAWRSQSAVYNQIYALENSEM
eukprot:CAMPEP_0201568190 /NCGR_PEP_ID=MMETSP0190_2-20130828/9137_1 /ASSEMBLY_ACC=CAM_ASM_000263 /TAXON_ID=37353 /ORGANISM="Rosalina sp." /LENGTH=208 /DNA_ID=CAMNT_0047989041 /DNA_START=85 /DNA_END=711 /DNA_ORIENTATION=-